ncbi:2,5-dichloro-2,5-cyclohexadiene-1,4-diol dehydrogenase [Myriangium duriaei CBS 260.36]|uniref:2,5-dichloro-2,5-cyclohexadiene-1,4-diol dehydrogenase n=1 Tax=Myriangium duriaei CBS 260.36 TaxID=1168546 RepID=A0A9P4IVQ6_9PEZI|nr:2,5-dichloro-2,5-cyclohexadiene-1,4-diol dehydrogenase [Myriangium duriaei CBS 260.36]
MSSNPPAQFPSSRLNGLVAIVTGGASPKGFGYAIAERYVAEGCRVVLADIDPSVSDSASQLSKSSGQVQGHRLDVTSRTSWEEAVKLCLDSWGRLDIVVNNAGTTYRNKSTLEVEEEEFVRVMDVNVKSIFWSVKVAVPAIQKGGRGGSIINVSSTGAVRPRPGLVWYNASKGAVSNATKGLAAEFGPDQIRVNAICPLLSATALFSQFVGVEDTTENRKKFAESIPLQRLTDPKDIANAAVFLASDEGKFITGTNFEVDGGRCI